LRAEGLESLRESIPSVHGRVQTQHGTETSIYTHVGVPRQRRWIALPCQCPASLSKRAPWTADHLAEVSQDTKSSREAFDGRASSQAPSPSAGASRGSLISRNYTIGRSYQLPSNVVHETAQPPGSRDWSGSPPEKHAPRVPRTRRPGTTQSWRRRGLSQRVASEREMAGKGVRGARRPSPRLPRSR